MIRSVPAKSRYVRRASVSRRRACVCESGPCPVWQARGRVSPPSERIYDTYKRMQATLPIRTYPGRSGPAPAVRAVCLPRPSLLGPLR